MTNTLLAIRVVIVASGLVLLGIGYWVSRNRDAPALWPFVTLVGVTGALAVTDGLAAGTPMTLSLVWLVAYLAIPATFAWFVVEYYGLPYLASNWQRAAFVTPLVAGVAGGAALVLSPDATGAMTGTEIASSAQYPTLLGVASVGEQIGIYYAGGLMLVASALLIRTVSTYEHLDGRLGVVLSFVAVWPWLAYFVTPGVAGTLPVEGIVGGTTSGYVFSCLAAGFAVTRGGLFEAAPAAGTLGPETVLAELDDAVVVVDHDERVVRLNRTAADTLATDEAAATGEPLAAVLGAGVETLEDAETVELEVAGGSRHFEATVSPVRDRLDRTPGTAVVLRDVTRERVRAQRLTVLNRVIRHNLRNEMSTIMGRAEVIASEDSEHSDVAEAILASADDRVELGERAHEVEEMMSVSSRAESAVTVSTLVGSVLERFRPEYPEASLSVDVESSLAVAVDDRILSQVLDNLVENALEHNDAPTPVVTVSARADSETSTVRLSVSDNGPGLPEHERTVIETETESPLEHGSGLGLWAVNWGVTRMGGELAFSDNQPEGTVVTVRLPKSVAGEPASSETAAEPA